MNETQKMAAGAFLDSVIGPAMIKYPNEVLGGFTGGMSGIKAGALLGLIKGMAFGEDGNLMKDTGMGALTGGLLGAGGGLAFGRKLGLLNKMYAPAASVPTMMAAPGLVAPDGAPARLMLNTLRFR